VWDSAGACVAVNPAIPYALGRLTEVKNTNSTTRYTAFDQEGRIIASEQILPGSPPVSYPFSYEYNLAGSLTKMLYPSGRQADLRYDGANRQDRLRAGVRSYATVNQFASHGAIKQMTMDNALVETAVFNERMQPASIQAALGANVLLGLSFDYGGSNNNGNVLQQGMTRLVAGQTKSWTQNYSYDPLNRLKTADEVLDGGTTWKQKYVYDRYGNRALYTGAGYYNPANTQAVEVSTDAPSAVEPRFPNNRSDLVNTWDAAGNARAWYGDSWFHEYDGENRMRAVTISWPYPVSHTYAYDGEGRRVRRYNANNGVVTWFVYDAFGNPAAEYTNTTPTGTTTEYLTSDHLGSTRLVTNPTGTELRCLDYLPFGQELAASTSGRGSCFPTGTQVTYPTTSADVLTQKFTGKERDAEPGLDYFGARYFSGAQGRFTSPDPIYFQKEFLGDPQRWNLYAYARNNPLRFIDPTGEAIELVGDEEERKKALAALQKGVGAQAGSYLYENKVTTKDKNGNEVTKYYVGIYTNGPDGKGPAFEKVNTAAASLGGIIHSQEVVGFGLVSNGTTLTNDLGNRITIGSLNDQRSPGVTSMFGGQLGIFILDPSTNPGRLPANMMNPSTAPGSVDQGILALHELGHAGYHMGALPDKNSNQSAVNLENMVRKNRDPKAPIRRQH
jgi:RHS repeat-associated protein